MRHRRRRTAVWSAVGGAALVGALLATLSPLASAQSSGPSADPARSERIPAVATGSIPAPRQARLGTVSAAALQRFWTPARLAAATPVDAATGAPADKASGSSRTAAVRAAAALPAGVGHSYDNARPSVGILVYADKNLNTHYCTASVVTSPGKSMILTAAHCRPGSWAAFVPDYQAGARTQPYGIWNIRTVYTDSRYAATGSGTDYDYAFAKVAPDSRGRLLQNVTGSNVLTLTPSYVNWAGVTGYPAVSSAPADKAITCWNWTSRLTGLTQMQFLCTGYYSGTSGSPWLIHLNSGTNSGDVIGVVGGYEYGGPNSWISYSPIFTRNTFTLYSYANSH
ncbi:serine protease [Streptacidiphilus sp. P02-A3a]|uniref:trypsin-like serine peptidase n=1 Tax=Streptacidiphilus sp. P02-A3a TaxID=2704468 RepID=UPI0015F8365E|nr:trypsin-like serine protease [Streptacidiphilus sp. P02-A3a]QMU73371.1 trypsin-like serine protease [Streptacidiphilus sp. P02-A3a]